MSTTIGVLSVIAAVGSFAAAAWVALFSRRQVESAQEQAAAAGRQVALSDEAIQQAEHTARIQLVIHFADQYHAILGNGLDLADAPQLRRFWGLHYLQFYYFQREDIPQSLYQLWMAELAEMYCKEPASWKSHEQYLLRFTGSFEPMYRFFRGLHETAERNAHAPVIRDNEVIKYVTEWPASVAASPNK
jgi:hypothetical protein